MNNRINSSVKTLGSFARVTLLAVSALLAAAPMGARAAFTAGNLAVFSADVASANNTTFTILELSPSTANQSSPVNSIAINGTTGANALRTSGSASSTGYLADSDDGTLLAFDAVNTTTTSGNVNAIATRAVGTLINSGTFALQTAYTAGVSGGTQARGATSINNSLWYITDQDGVYTNGSARLNSANGRSVKSFGGTLYVLQASSTATVIVVSTLSADGKTVTGLTGLTNDSTAQDFYLISSGSSGSTYDVLYVLTTAGIKKYSLVSGTWTANSSYATVTGFGLCAAQSGSGAVLYVTTGTGATAANKAMQVTDTAGYNSTISITTGNNVTLYIAAAGTTMKGIAFAPVAAATAPTVASSAATSIGTTTATLNGNVTSDGGATVTDRGFVYKTSSGVTISDNKTTVSGTTGSYTLNLSSLGVNAQYFFKAYAINSVATTLSSPELSFWTLASTPNAPIVGNNPTATTLDVSIGSDSNPANTTYAIQETGSGSFVQANGSLAASAVFQTAAAWGTVTVTGLSPSTPYTFQVEAQNGGGVTTGFGSIASGTTSAAASPTISVIPTFLSFSPTVVNGTSTNLTYAVSGLNLTANIVITAPGNFEISTSSGSGFGSSLTLTQSGGTVPSRTIYVHFKPTAQTSYSDSITHVSSGANNPSVAVSGTGALAPSVSTQAATTQTSTGATLNGTVTAANDASIADRGFYWKTSPGVSTSDTQASEGGTTVSAYSKALTGLGANTIYYYRAYAVNVIGTTLDGADTSFYTLANTPTAPTVNGATTSSLNVAIGSGDGNPASTTYAIQETTGGKYVQADGSLDTTAVYQTTASWGTKAVTGLSLGTVYGFKVKAANGASVDTSFGATTSAITANNPFTPGNLAVYRLGDGSGALSSVAAAVFVDELTTSGGAVQSVPLPSTEGSAFVNSGSASSEGALMLSPDGQVLCFAGYNAAAGTAGVAATSAARAVGTLSRAATFTVVTTSTLQYAANNFRGAATDGANNFWGAGANSGTYYFGLASAAAAVQTTAANTRVINIFNGNLYFSASSGGFKGVSVITGLPTASSSTTLIISDTNSAYGFAVNPAGTLAYVADDTTSASGGILRYDYSGGAWSLTYMLGTGAASIGARGLAVDWSGSSPVIYATTAEGSANRLVKITDTGSASTATTLATASPNTIFRGVAFAPKNSQTITFASGTSVTKAYGDAAFSDGATASSGLTVTCSSDNASVATVDGGGTVTIMGAGTAHIQANQAGNALYGAAPQVSQTLTVSQASTSVAVSSSSQTSGYKDSVNFTATLPADAAGSVTFKTNGFALSVNSLSSGIATSDATTLLPRGPNTITAEYAGFGNYLGSTNTLNQVVTNHPPVAVDATYYRIQDTSLQITISVLLTNVTDVDGDTIALQSVGAGANGAAIATDGTYIHYVPGSGPNGNSNDSFTYTVSDGFGGNATANVLVDVYSAAGPAQLTMPSNGVVNIKFFGIPTHSYVVQTTTNLSTLWSPISTNTAGTTGFWLFTDPNATNAQQYYRAAQP